MAGTIERQGQKLDSGPVSSIAATCVSKLEEDQEPRLLTERLGRVLSSSSSLDENEENNVLKSILHPQRPLMRKTISAESAQYGQWLGTGRMNLNNEKDIASTIDELKQLIRLANMNSADYHKQLLDNSLETFKSSEPQNYATSDAPSAFTSIRHQTTQLSMAIHRLHSVVTNLTEELDSNTEERESLQSQILISQQQNKTMEQAIQKLYRQNRKLKRQTQYDKKALQKLKSQVDEYRDRVQASEAQLMTSQLYQHELHLQLQQKIQTKSSQTDGDSTITSANSERERAESPFSELCLEDIGFDIPPEDDMSGVQSLPYDKSINDVSSKSISINNMFENTKPTLCFSANGRTDVNDCTERNKADIRHGLVTRPVGNRLLESHETKVGVQDSVPVPSESHCVTNNVSKPRQNSINNEKKSNGVDRLLREKRQAFPGMMSNINKTFKLFGNMPSNYTLKMMKPFDMQFSTLEVNVPVGAQTGCGKQETAFVVVGFEGFDEEANDKPTLGARLVRIDGVDVDPKWDLEKLHATIYHKPLKKATTSLTFRNEMWTAAQNKAIQNAAGSKTSILGEMYQSIDDNPLPKERCHSLEDIRLHPASRPRARSAEAVGKAIGSFLQTFKDGKSQY